jgi:hypothetical protein
MDEFRQRVAAMQKKGRKKARPRFNVSGPDTVPRKIGYHFPWSVLGVVLALALAMKVMILIEYGEDRYRWRLSGYTEPDFGEKIGVFVMQLDPITLQIRDFALKAVAR